MLEMLSAAERVGKSGVSMPTYTLKSSVVRPSPSALREVMQYELNPLAGVRSTKDCMEPGSAPQISLIIAPSRIILKLSLPESGEPSMAVIGAVKLIVASFAPLAAGVTVTPDAASGTIFDIPALTLMSSSSR